MGVGWVWKIIFLLVMAILGFHVLFYDPVLKRGWKLAHLLDDLPIANRASFDLSPAIRRR